jgi:hypothetical protein
LGEGFGAAGDFAERAQVLHQLTLRQGCTDRRCGERFAIGAECEAASLQCAAGEGDVVGDDDVARLHALRDPVVCHIRTGFDDGELGVRRHANEGIGYNLHGAARTARDFVNLLLHRTGIGVDEDGGRGHVAALAHFEALRFVRPQLPRAAEAPDRAAPIFAVAFGEIQFAYARTAFDNLRPEQLRGDVAFGDGDFP